MTELTAYSEKQQLSKGVYVFDKGCKTWGDEMNRNMEILNSLCDRKTLSVKDSEDNVLVEFDGSTNKILTLPANQDTAEIKTLTIKDADGNVLAVFDGSEEKEVTIGNNLDLPGGGSFVVETEMSYATIYLTEEAIRKLGYSGFEDAELLKYRSTVGKYNISDVANSEDFIGGTWGVTPFNALEVADGGDVYNDKYEPNFGQFKYPYIPYNTALRVNVLDEKEVSYLGTTTNYLSDLVKNKVNSMTDLEALKTRFNSVDDDSVLEVHFAVYDSDGDVRSASKGCTRKYAVDGDDIASAVSALIPDYSQVGYELEEKFTSGCTIKIAVAVTEMDGDLGGIYGSNMYSYQGLEYASPKGISKGSWNWGDSDISTSRKFDSFYGEMASQGNIVIFTQDLCTYQEFQDSIVPFSTIGLPIRVPADKVEYLGPGNSLIFNYYTYKLYIHKGNGFGYNVLFGQNIGNGLLIDVKDDQLVKIAVIEGDDECGETTFREVHPK